MPNGRHAERVVFQSDWSTATDTSRHAVRDGRRWKNYWEFNRDTGVDFVDRRQVLVHPRVYEASDSLILSDADFRQLSWGSASHAEGGDRA